MAHYADLTIALILEPVTLTYLKHGLIQEGVQIVATPQGEELFKIGEGEVRILITSGYSLHDYKLVNALTLLLVNTRRDIRLVRGIPASVQEQCTVYAMPVVNKYAYSRGIVTARSYKRSLLDEQGIPVVHDMLTLQSRYSMTLHQVINDVRPHVKLTLIDEKTLRQFKKIRKVDDMALVVHCVEETVCDNLTSTLQDGVQRQIEIVKVRSDDVQLVQDHVALEERKLTVLTLCVQSENVSTVKIAETLCDIVSTIPEVVKRAISITEVEAVRREITLKTGTESLTRQLVKILEHHKVDTEIKDEQTLIVKYNIDNPLHRLLFEQGLIEKYFNTKIIREAS